MFNVIKGDQRRQDFYCSVVASDSFGSNCAAIEITGNREVDVEYGLRNEDFGDNPPSESDYEEDEETETTVYDRFEMALPSLDKRLVGPEVVNSWTFDIYTRRRDIQIYHISC